MRRLECRVAADGAGGDRRRAVVEDAAAAYPAELPLKVEASIVSVPAL